MGTRFRSIALLLTLLAVGGAQAQGIQKPLSNLDRQGRLIQNGVLFHFADPPRRMRELGALTVVNPWDGPEGEKDYPGEEQCERSMVLALTEMATKAREKGGDAVISVSTDPQAPSAKSRSYLCDRGRVVVTGTVVSTR